MVTADRHHLNTTASPSREHQILSVIHQNNSIISTMTQNQGQLQQQLEVTAATKPVDATTKEAIKSAVSQRSVDLKISKKSISTQEIKEKVLKLDLVSSKEMEGLSIKSPKSPVAVRMPHQTSVTSSVDVEDRKTLREALYQGIFHRHRRTIFAVGSFLRMLRSRNSQYNSIRSSSEGEDMDEVR